MPRAINPPKITKDKMMDFIKKHAGDAAETAQSVAGYATEFAGGLRSAAASVPGVGVGIEGFSNQMSNAYSMHSTRSHHARIEQILRDNSGISANLKQAILYALNQKFKKMVVGNSIGLGTAVMGPVGGVVGNMVGKIHQASNGIAKGIAGNKGVDRKANAKILWDYATSGTGVDKKADGEVVSELLGWDMFDRDQAGRDAVAEKLSSKAF